MRLNKKLLALLAIFCVIASASIVCAEETGSGDYYEESASSFDTYSEPVTDSGNAAGGDNYDPGVPYHGDGTDPTGNETGNTTGNLTGNTTGNLTGNQTGNTTNSTNATNATNTTNATNNHGLLSTGNPILILLVVILVIVVAYAVFKKQ